MAHTTEQIRTRTPGVLVLFYFIQTRASTCFCLKTSSGATQSILTSKFKYYDYSKFKINGQRNIIVSLQSAKGPGSRIIL